MSNRETLFENDGTARLCKHPQVSKKSFLLARPLVASLMQETFLAWPRLSSG
jgi:hypothetical protein